jgi:hypothetical protein
MVVVQDLSDGGNLMVDERFGSRRLKPHDLFYIPFGWQNTTELAFFTRVYINSEFITLR